MRIRGSVTIGKSSEGMGVKDPWPLNGASSGGRATVGSARVALRARVCAAAAAAAPLALAVLALVTGPVDATGMIGPRARVGAMGSGTIASKASMEAFGASANAVRARTRASCFSRSASRSVASTVDMI